MKDHLILISHILDAIRLIEEYTGSITKEEFLSRSLIQDGVMRKLAILVRQAGKCHLTLKINTHLFPGEKLTRYEID